MYYFVDAANLITWVSNVITNSWSFSWATIVGDMCRHLDNDTFERGIWE